PKCLHTALTRSHKVKNDPYQKERQHITFGDMAPTPPHGHQKIGGSSYYGDKHTHTKDYGHGLQPPWKGAKYKMVSTDHGIEQHLRPKSKYTQGIGIYRLVQGGWKV